MESSTLNFTQIISNTINVLIDTILSSINNKLYNILDDLTFINSDIISGNAFLNVFGNASSGILLVSNSLLIGFLLYFCIKLLLSYVIFIPVMNPIQVVFKSLFYGIFMNFSYFICELMISFNSYVSLAIRNVGEIALNTEICFSTLILKLNSTVLIENSTLNIFTIEGILKSFSSVGLLSLVCSYSFRYILIQVFVLISPICFLSLITNYTSWFFKAWFKCFLSLLLIQPFISIILLVIFSIDFSSEISSKFMCIGAIYSLIKANSLLRDFIGGISTDINAGINILKNKY